MKVWSPSGNSRLPEILEGIPYELCTEDPPLEGTVLVTGTEQLARIQKLGLLPKNRTIGSLRGKPFALGEATGFISYGPGLSSFEPRFVTDLRVDALRALRFDQTGSLDATLGQYEYVEDFDEIFYFIENNDPDIVPIGFDLETLGLDEYAPEAWIISIQISPRVGHTAVLRFDSKEESEKALGSEGYIRQQLETLLTHPRVKIRGANLKYDLRWLWVHCELKCTNFSMDTTLIGSLLDENRANSLENHTWIYAPELGGYDWELNVKYDKGRMDLVPLEDFLPYAGGDPDAVLRVSDAQIQDLSLDQGLLNFYVRLLHPASVCFLEMENTGVLVDQVYYEGFKDAMEVELEALRDTGRGYLFPDILEKHDEEDLNLTKAALVRQQFFSEDGWDLTPIEFTPKAKYKDGRKMESTKLSHLKEVVQTEEQKEYVALLEQFSKASKTMSTYIVGFLSHLKFDGRFHPSYILHKREEGDGGTNTGRTSCKAPAVQTTPKHTIHAPYIRRAMIAPYGQCMLQHDFSQGELRITACLANEANMIKAYKAGIDLHSITGYSLMYSSMDSFEQIAAAMAQMFEADPKEAKRIRQAGKSANFGLIYGISAEGFQEYALNSYGVHLTLEFCQMARERFLYQMYPGLPEWHTAYKAFATENQYVRSPLGRVRHLPHVFSPSSEIRSKALRQSINAPVQSTLSDLALLSMVEFKKRYPESPLRHCMMVHDSLVSYVPWAEHKLWAYRLKVVMETLPLQEYFGWTPQLKFDVDVEVGSNLADLKEMEFDLLQAA